MHPLTPCPLFVGNSIPGVKIPADAISRRPSIPLEVLTDDVALKAFLGVLDWYIAEVKAA
jgi:hypothetical protein